MIMGSAIIYIINSMPPITGGNQKRRKHYAFFSHTI